MKRELKSDYEVLKCIAAQDRNVILDFINAHYSGVRSFVKRHKGNDEDVEDVIQEGMMALYKIARKKDIVLNKTLSDYFYGMVRILWFNRFRMNIKTADHIDVEKRNIVDDTSEDIIDAIHINERYELYEKHINELHEDCKIFFELLSKGYDLKEIAEFLDISIKHMYKKKSNCKKKLMERIQNDPKYKELNEN